MSVPLAAVFAKDGVPALWVVAPVRNEKAADGESVGSLHLQPVQLGPYGEERVPVISGISPNDWVLAAGVHLVREGQRILPVDRDNRPIALEAQRSGNSAPAASASR
jgi:multidrug efflux system membrane fusion protein